jgi:tetratricopeptide (TPR) repeat protein
VRVLGVTVVLLALAFSVPARAAGEEGAELKARTHFAAGEYKEALEIYARLYAETMHPTYLRNIARCHQNLGNADKAISSFREYLRKAHDLTPDQRKEIEGYIAEMEQLKQSRAGAAADRRPAADRCATTARCATAAGYRARAGRPTDGDGVGHDHR